MWFAWWNLPRLRQILVLAGDKGRRGWTKHDSTPFRFQLYCQNMCGPANAHCLSMFCQGCILMYFTSDQRNFLEFGNVCPNQNFVYCDKPCGCKVAERNIMSCNVGMQFFLQCKQSDQMALNSFQWLKGIEYVWGCKSTRCWRREVHCVQSRQYSMRVCIWTACVFKYRIQCASVQRNVMACVAMQLHLVPVELNLPDLA
jgi:hypothetical protein